ncbi:MAG: chemotaxis protein CheW [Leptolyngbyaceae cyanobacterium SM2_3_12]|nr:chemotaxis protein CheW [Leptolyngbyaceae cyanobacterium SM2_3_12]
MAFETATLEDNGDSLESQHGLTPGDPSVVEPVVADQYLHIALGQDPPLLLPVPHLVEILKIPIIQVVPMFQMADWVLGVYNWRGEMLWIADLGHFLGLLPWYQQPDTPLNHTVVIIQPPLDRPLGVGEKQPQLGLVVSAVKGMAAYPAETMVPELPDIPLPPAMVPLLQGHYADQPDGLRMVLDGVALLEAMARSPD